MVNGEVKGFEWFVLWVKKHFKPHAFNLQSFALSLLWKAIGCIHVIHGYRVVLHHTLLSQTWHWDNETYILCLLYEYKWKSVLWTNLFAKFGFISGLQLFQDAERWFERWHWKFICNETVVWDFSLLVTVCLKLNNCCNVVYEICSNQTFNNVLLLEIWFNKVVIFKLRYLGK